MSNFLPSNFKAILHSKRANIYYLEQCRVMVKSGRVVYLTEAKNERLYWNIPIANTTVILLGTGTSITQLAVRMLASAGVLIGFSGSGGTPLISANEIEWLCPQSEYRPTEYVQGWLGFWFEDIKRLQAAQNFQLSRLDYLTKIWRKDRDLHAEGFFIDDTINNILYGYREKISNSNRVGDLLLHEANLTKLLYRVAAKNSGLHDFVREHQSTDAANQFLNHGNYFMDLLLRHFGCLVYHMGLLLCTEKLVGEH